MPDCKHRKRPVYLNRYMHMVYIACTVFCVSVRQYMPTSGTNTTVCEASRIRINGVLCDCDGLVEADVNKGADGRIMGPSLALLIRRTRGSLEANAADVLSI